MKKVLILFISLFAFSFCNAISLDNETNKEQIVVDIGVTDFTTTLEVGVAFSTAEIINVENEILNFIYLNVDNAQKPIAKIENQHNISWRSCFLIDKDKEATTLYLRTDYKKNNDSLLNFKVRTNKMNIIKTIYRKTDFKKLA